MLKSFLKLALVALTLATITGLADPDVPPPHCYPCCGEHGDEVCPRGGE